MEEKQVLKLTSPIPPSVNHYLAYRVVMKDNKPLGMSYKTKEATKYRSEFAKYVISEVEKQGWTLEPNKTQHFYAFADFYFPQLDLDPNNYWKIPLDAITDTGLIWLDDNVVCEQVRRIYYDSSNPRIEFEITPVDYIGIFDNTEEFEKFSSKCGLCTRGTRNCSIKKKAVEGRIQNEINMTDKSCSSYKEKKQRK